MSVRGTPYALEINMKERNPDRRQKQNRAPSEEQRQVEEEKRAVANYKPKGGKDLVPPPEPARPADGELGAGD